MTGQEWVSLSMVTVYSPRGFAVLRSFSGAQALDRMAEMAPDLLIVDRDLGDMSGVEFCERLLAAGSVGPPVPILVISSGPWMRESRLEALRAGAWDVCSLPIDSEELFLRTDAWVRAKLAADVARDESLLDPDTGLYNTHGLLRRIAELGAGAVRHRRPLACVVLSAEPDASDDERPRPVLTTATWTADSARSLAATLVSTGRASDAIGRLSATEFVILAPDTDDDGVLGLADRLRRAMEEQAQSVDHWRVRFGCYAVTNMRDASIAPSEMLIRAAEALRGADPEREPVRFFRPSPEALN